MGSYLGKPAPQPPAPPREARSLREPPGPGCRTPTSSVRPAHSLCSPHHIRPSLPPHPPTQTPFCRHRGTSSGPFVITPLRQYPIQQAQYSLLGVLPTVCWNGNHKKTVLSARNSRMVCGPVTVRIPPPDRRWTRSLRLEQVVSSPLPSRSSNAIGPCAKETIPSTLKEKNERSVEEEEPIFDNGQEKQTRCPESSGSGHLVFEPLMASAVPAAFVPTPEAVRRGLNSQSSADPLLRSSTSLMSSSEVTYTSGIPISGRNAITSSYSSTSLSHFQVPERPAKKTREENTHLSSSSTPRVTEKASCGDHIADTAMWEKQNSQDSPMREKQNSQDSSMWEKQNSQNSSSVPDSSRARKRKVQLLPSRRGKQLTLPPPPLLGYSITAEDLDLEKKASLRWLNKILEDKTDMALSSVTESPYTTTQPLTLPTIGPVSSTDTLPTPDTNPLLESLKMHSSPVLPALPESTGVALTPEAHMLPKTPDLPVSLGSLQSVPLLPSISLNPKSTVTFLGLTPASSIIPVADTTESPQAETSIKSQTLTAPTPHPKQSILFGMLSTSPNPSASATTGVSSASPKRSCSLETPPESDNEDPLPSRHSKVTASSNSVFPITPSVGPLQSVPLSSPFSQTAIPATTTSNPLFTRQASATSTVVSVAAASIRADSASKPAFAVSVSNMTNTMSSETSTTTSQPFFGTPPASGASSVPSVDTILQFGKPPAIPTSVAVTTFGQPLPGATQISHSSIAGFRSFGSPPTGSAPVTTSQPTLTSTTTPAVSIPFGPSTKPSITSPPGTSPWLTSGATDGQQQGALSSSSSFTLGSSVAPAAIPAPALSSTTALFSMGAAPTPDSGARAQTASSGASSSSLTSTTVSSLFMLGGSAVPAATGDFGIHVASSGTSSTSGAFCFGTEQSGTSGNTASFGRGRSQSTLGTPHQSTDLAINVVSTLKRKTVCGGTSTPTFGLDTPAPKQGTSRNRLVGASSAPSQGFVGGGSFRSNTPLTVGAGSKIPGTRQRGQARRQLSHKK